ncbi:hypothetical protein NPIL_89691 [Nephila pilipes]|uniref:Uncharacterized protein n=1 Tax=Nephila pilipes TaxID=299642 RepID=A0A8X6N112_NEPPI|nr:hypothetical protein NPIL_89691 [Nephila pilipes]
MPPDRSVCHHVLGRLRILTGKSGRPRKEYGQVSIITDCFETSPSAQEARAGPNKITRKNSMKEEHDALIKENAWTLVPRPKHKKYLLISPVFPGVRLETKTVLVRREEWIAGLSNFQNRKMKKQQKNLQTMNSETVRRSKRIQMKLQEADCRNLKQECFQCKMIHEEKGNIRKNEKPVKKIITEVRNPPPPQSTLLINELYSQRHPEIVQGIWDNNNKKYALVKWENSDVPEYVEIEKASEEILKLLKEYLLRNQQNEQTSFETGVNMHRYRIKQEENLKNCNVYIKLE